MLTLHEIVTTVAGVYGDVILSEEQCPGVYYLACREDENERPKELVVVERGCPHISAAAKAYGSPLDGHDDLLVYDFNAMGGGREVVLYEAYRYLTLHGLPIPDENTLLTSAAYSAADYPKYFGATPAPTVTPQGYLTRYIALADGIFALETDTGARLIAVAGTIWRLELQDTTISLGMKVGNSPHTEISMDGAALAGGAVETGVGAEIPVEVQFLFFSEEDGCLALFELLPAHDALLRSAQLDWLALMNAIWQYHPDYALTHNLREQQGLNDILGQILKDVGIEYDPHGSAENMVALSPEAGTEYVQW